MRGLTYIFIALLLFACKKDETLSVVPAIEFQNINPLIAQEYIDDIIITISYTDEDGNLGENNPDIHNLFVQDNRYDIEYEYRIPELTPSGSDISITGNFNIKINWTVICRRILNTK